MYCLHMHSSVNPELVRELAECVDDGRRVNMRNLARELSVDIGELDNAYRELVRQRGCDPLLDRIYRHSERLRQMAGR